MAGIEFKQRCKKVKLGEAKVTQVLDENYPVVQFDPGRVLKAKSSNYFPNQSYAGFPRLKASMDIYRTVFENAPDSVILVDKQGRIVSVNFECERAMGYGKGELMGLKIETLIPSRFAEGHVQLREGYFDAPHRRSMGSGMKLFAQRKDGSEFPVDIMINMAETETGPVVIAIIRDLTERIEFESRQALLTATLERRT